MKQNRKNKKLSFIRQKNKYRKGIDLFITTHQMSDDVDLTEDIINNLVSLSKTLLKESFKLELRNSELTRFIIEDDFVNNTSTIIVSLFN